MKRLLLCFAILAGCDDRPPAPTAAESDRLNEAESMLNEEGPAPAGTGPSKSD